MSIVQFDDHFALVREPAGSRFRARLVEAARISQAMIATRRAPEPGRSEESWSETDLSGLVESLDYFVAIQYEEKPSRFVFTLEGVDSELYLLSLAALPHGFDVFASSASLSYFRYEDPARVEPLYQGTADFVEHFVVGVVTAEQAYLQGLSRIAGHIRAEQHQALPTKPTTRGAFSALVPVGRQARSFACLNPAAWDAGFFAYGAGLLGAAAMMASGAGPGWLGFAVGFVPASMLAAWAVAPHA